MPLTRSPGPHISAVPAPQSPDPLGADGDRPMGTAPHGPGERCCCFGCFSCKPPAPPGILIPQNCHPGELPVTVPSPGAPRTPQQIPSCTGGSLVLPASLAHTSPEVHAGALSPSSSAVSSPIKSSCRSSPPFPLPPDPRVSRAPLSEPTLGSDIISLPRYISSAVDLR